MGKKVKIPIKDVKDDVMALPSPTNEEVHWNGLED